MAKKTIKKFKAIDKGNEWEGEELSAEADTKLEQDTGTGEAIILRFFDFGADPLVFKDHKPSAQELFNGHIKGIEALLWGDGLKPYEGVEPRLMFSKDKKFYRFIIACKPTIGSSILETPQTLTDLITKK